MRLARYGAVQDIMLGKIWRSLVKIWHWARYWAAGQDISLGKISQWARYGASKIWHCARYRAEQDMALARYGTGQDIALGKISHWARY